MFNFAAKAAETQMPNIEPLLAETEAKLADALAVGEKFHEVSTELVAAKRELDEARAALTDVQDVRTELATLKQMIDAMPVNVMTLNLEDFTIDYVNKTSLDTLATLEHLLPIKADRIVGQCIDIFHENPEHQRNLLKDVRNLPHKADIQIGDEWLSLQVDPMYDLDGKYIAPMLTWSVVTEKIKTDRASQQLQQMVDQMPINVMMCDPKDLVINYVNKTSINTLKGLEHLLPIKADDLLGTCIDIFHKNPDHQRRLLGDPSNLPYNTHIEIGDETLELQVDPITDADGGYIGPMLSWTVATAKVKAAAETERLVATLTGIGASQAMIEFETDGAIITANDNFLDALGYTASELEGGNHSMFVDPTQRDGADYRRFWDELRSGRFQAGEYMRIRKNGDEIWIQAAYNPVIDADGKVTKVVKNAVDITEKKKAAMTMVNRVSEVVGNVATTATEMQTAAEGMASTAEETSRQSQAAAAASEEASTNVQTVSAAAEEMSSSINEIARQVAHSATMAKAAVEEAQRTNDTVQGLAEGSQRIGEVVEMISNIASQTNLLALNATIEAARAGEAGKGFAVVASEVKSLATQTAKATEQIAAQITAIQSSTDDAVGAIKGIGEKIAEMDEVTSAIASAIEEQGAATGEISSNSQQAALGTQEVSSNVAGLNQAATETGSAAGQVLQSASGLSSLADDLRGEVDKFMKSLNAA